MDVGIRYGDGRWPDLKSTFLLRDAFFPVCSPALLEGMHPLRGPEDLKHHTTICLNKAWMFTEQIKYPPYAVLKHDSPKLRDMRVFSECILAAQSNR